MKYPLIILLLFVMLGCHQNKKDKEVKMETKEVEQTETIELLVGTYTSEKSKGIYRVQFNITTGSLTNTELVAETESPSYMSISNDGLQVFAVNETDSGSISSFRWNEDRSHLDFVDQQPSEGMHPCYVAIHPKENMVAVANYSSGNIAVYKVDEQGRFLSPSQTKQHQGSGPVKPNQDAPRAHFAAFDKEGTYLYVVDLGIDQVILYPVSEDGILGESRVALKMDKGDGPRHLVFHPNKNLVFIVNELSNTVVSAKIDSSTGLMKHLDKKSTLPEGFAGKSFCADIHISEDGQFIYASNRGHNSIAIFKVSENGEIDLMGTESVRGEWPRNFAISPSGKHLLVANQNSNNVTVFEIHPQTGMLSYTGQNIELERPVCIKF